MPNRVLIVNADDCNLTKKVTEAILECHEKGIVTSTTFFVNLPVVDSTVKKLAREKELGVGLHLNLTLGEPVSPKNKVKSLLQSDGKFKRPFHYAENPPKASEVLCECNTQLLQFKKIFKKLSTHLDSHHQLHDNLLFLKSIVHIAKKNKLPVRPSRILSGPRIKNMFSSLKKADRFYGNLDPDTFWTEEALRDLFMTLQPGINEVMCHPGRVDNELKGLSRMISSREKERQVFSSKNLRGYIKKLKIKLTNYGELF